MKIFRAVAVLLLVALVVAGAGLWWIWRPALAPRAEGAGIESDKTLIGRGADLATLGNCGDCHTAEGKPALSGGRPLPTPFGTIYASNLTPDRETGIGSWTEEAFRRAMREGVDREGRQLYPAFPYDHFTFVTDEDVRSIYAFLMSRPAVSSRVPENQLGFPFNIRPIVAGWKLLFLHQDPLRPDPAKGEDWNRGRYLVEGLGHCGSCHTPRNTFGAEKKGSLYAGGVADGWNAPPLDASLIKAHRWTVDQLADYLATGWQRQHGVAAGPMADVAKNLGSISRKEVRAIATYVASLSAGAPAAGPASSPEGKALPESSAAIAALYDGACARCHNGRGEVGPSQALPLPLSTAVHAPGSANAVRAVLQGIESYRRDGGPYMPAFGGMFSDAQVAALVQYVRARYSDQPLWTDVEAEVAKARKEGAQP